MLTFLTSIALAALLWQAPAGDGASKVFVRGNEIWLRTASGERQLTHDGTEKRLPTLSPSGDKLIYVVDHPVPNNPAKEEIIVLDMEGNIRKRIIPEGYVPGEFDRLDWIDEDRMGAMTCGHANCMYWVINPRSGKTIEVMQGGFEYTWSHNRRHVAIWDVNCDEPHQREKPCREHDAVELHPGGASYPPEWAGHFDDSYRFSHSHDIGSGAGPVFVWSPDDQWVAFTDLIGPEDNWYVVILSPAGKMLRDTLPIDPDYKATLQWLDNTHLELRANKQTFHFALEGEQFSEVGAAERKSN